MENLREMLIRHEGWKNKAYVCSAGHKTIGVGWNLDANTLPSDIASYFRLYNEITDEMVNRLLDFSIEAATKQCEALYTGFDTFSEQRQKALIDFVFNVGVGTATKFRKMRAAVNLQNWGRAADELMDSRYYRQLGGDPAGTDDGRLERSEEIIRMLKEG